MKWHLSHQWEVVGKYYTAPRFDLKGIERCSEELLERMLFGITTILMRCTECGAVEPLIVKGDASKQ